MQEIAFKIKFLYCFLSTRKVLFFDTKIFQTFRSWVDCQMMLLAYVVRGHSRNATPSFWILEPINIKFLPKVCFMKCYAELALNDFIHINIDFIPQSMKKNNSLVTKYSFCCITMSNQSSLKLNFKWNSKSKR